MKKQTSQSRATVQRKAAQLERAYRDHLINLAVGKGLIATRAEALAASNEKLLRSLGMMPARKEYA